RRAIADPFAPTAQEVALLRERARQLTAPSRTPLLRRLAPKGLAPAH
ncbi:MAG: hypothetical protein QOD73_2020, partial [Solirubrobacteraceae bacterium]|nr:hypothetical protein [Solirubrobacteraceae bacterium]